MGRTESDDRLGGVGEAVAHAVRRVTRLGPLATRNGDCGRFTDDRKLVREFHERFLVALGRCTGPRDALLLSGGIDSSALTCAYQQLPAGRAGGRRVLPGL